MAKVQIVEYPGEIGVCFQHLGILVGRHARAHVWPEILSWLQSQNWFHRADASPNTMGCRCLKLARNGHSKPNVWCWS